MKNNYLKLGMMAAVMLSASIGFAQKTTSAAAATDFGKEGNTVLGAAGGSVKVIDNKGTIKYLQSNNGLTTFTDVTPNGGVVTTWQLGGTLTSATTITTTASETLAIKGLETEGGNAAIAGGTPGGYALVVQDEVTGLLKKLYASDIVDLATNAGAITGILQEYVQGTNVNANAAALEPNATVDVDIVVNGLQILDLSTSAKLSVYRNGVKLRFGTDFTVETDGAAVAPIISVQIPISGDVPLYEADVVEIQYVN